MDVRWMCWLTLLTLFSSNTVESARILSLFPFPGKSHFNTFSKLLEELAKRGHEVTVVSAYPRSSPLPNYEDVTIDDYWRQSGEINMFERREANVFLRFFFLPQMMLSNCERFLSYPQIQDLIKSNQQFDLILFEIFFSECAYGFVHKYKVPFIQISSNTFGGWSGQGVGNPTFFSYNPEIFLEYTDHMSFCERFMNSIFGTFILMIRNWKIIPYMEEIMRKHFQDPTIPSIYELENNASFLLLNSHVSLNYPRPLTPNTAEVGGMHISEPKKLPEDLQKYLDNAPHGVIYFSFGSHIRSTQMPESIRKVFLEVFSGLKQNILWKWETDSLPGQPKNVRIGKWLPQNDILAHPNIKLFITHGGLLSSQEATYHGKPLVVLPVMGDQKVNAKKVEKAGNGVALDLSNITTESLSWSVNEVLSKPSYAENAQRLSRLLRDQPSNPLDRAVFWVEYVIRHNGAPHMRSAALKLNFFQYYCLDVIAVVLIVSLVVFHLVVKACRALCRRVFSSKPKQATQSKKNR